jgi:steroid 5-alpha reductase family enzyme
MNLSVEIPLVAWAVCALVMLLVWIWAYRIKNAGVVDIFWAFNFLLIAAVCWWLGDGQEPRKTIMCVLLAAWSIRLGIYLLIRVGGHLETEEGRYAQLRKEWGPKPDRAFFFFFQAQALSNIFLSIPFFIVCRNPGKEFHALEAAGALIWLLAIIGEGLSDYQLMAFKKNPANKGLVCDKGLWNYSRHPNYFFQFMIWVGVFIFSLNTPYGWISAICPLTIFYLIWKVTGIPMTEEQAVRSKGDRYRDYQQRTSIFIPLPPKKK